MNHIPKPVSAAGNANSAQLVGQVRRFGPLGVIYEIIGIVSPSEALIRVITTGEEAAYPIAHILSDPVD